MNLHKKELYRGAFASLVVRLIGMALAYVLTLLITWIFGAEGMGAYAFGLAIINILAIVGRLGLDTALVKFISQFRARGEGGMLRPVYNRSLLLLCGSCLTAIAVFLLLHKVIPALQLSDPDIVCILLALPAFVIANINAECLRGMKRIIQFTFYRSVSISLWAIAILFFIPRDVPGLTPALAAWALASWITGISSFLSWKKLLRSTEQTEAGGTLPGYQEILAQSVPMMLAGSLLILLHWIDIFMLGILATKEVTGIYNVAFRLSSLSSMMLISVNSIAAPKYAELFQGGEPGEFRSFVKHSTRLGFLSNLPIIVVLMIFPEFFLGLFGPGFESGAMVLVVLCLGNLVSSLSGSTAVILQMTEMQIVLQRIMLIATCVNVALNLALIPILGGLGAAVASTACMAFWNIAAVLIIRHRHGFWSLPF